MLHWELGVLFTPRTLARRNAAAPFAIGGGGGRVPFRLPRAPAACGAADDAADGDDALAELVTTRALARAVRAERDSAAAAAAPVLVMPVPFELPARPHPPGAEPWHSDGAWPSRPDAYGAVDCSRGPAAPSFYGLAAAPAQRVP